MHLVTAGTQRHRRAEAHAAIGPQVHQKIGFSHTALEIRIKMRQSLLVVVDVGAVHGAAAGVIIAAFKGEHQFAVQHHHGIGAQDGCLAGHGIDQRCRQRGGVERVAIFLRARAQGAEFAQGVNGGLPGRAPFAAVFVLERLIAPFFFVAPVGGTDFPVGGGQIGGGVDQDLAVLLRESGVGRLQVTAQVHRRLADHFVLEISIFPARITIDVQQRDLGIQHGDLLGDALDEAHVVLHHHQRMLALEREKQLRRAFRLLVGHAGDGLVEQ